MRRFSRVIVLLVLAGALVGSPSSRAQRPLPDYRFQWIDEIEQLSGTEREGPASRPAPARGIEAVSLAAPGFFDDYRTSAEVTAFLDDLAATYPDLTKRFAAGESLQGRPINGIRVGNESTGNPDQRPALYLDGQHHAREAISTQSLLYTLWWLLSEYGQDPLATHLLNTRTVYAIPSVNVDGNDIWLQTDFEQRRNANPSCCDDDGDGALDEDPANGRGWGTFQVYRYTFDSQWIAWHPDDPFAIGWQSHIVSVSDMGIWDSEDRVVPQLDDDVDHHPSGPNEDPVGGVDLNRNYDAHWELGDRQPARETYRGTAVWSEPEARAVRDTILAHPNIVVAASLHSGADSILFPWGWSNNAALPDGQVLERIARKGSQLTECCGFMGSRHAWTARGLYQVFGGTGDWMYAQGIYVFTPEVYAASSTAKVRRDTDPAYPNSYFVYTSLGVLFNPQQGEMLQSCERWRGFLVYLLAAVPATSFARVDAAGSALTVRIANDGGISVDLSLQASTNSGEILSAKVQGLRAREYLWTLPVESAIGSTVTITATARTPISTNPRDFQRNVLQVRVADGSLEVVSGETHPFVTLADFFGEGGWDADPRRWERDYHLGPPIGYTLKFPVVIQ